MSIDNIFMGDKPWPHRDDILVEFLEKEDIHRMDGPRGLRILVLLNMFQIVWEQSFLSVAHPSIPLSQVKFSLSEEWTLLP
ncbi:hypothetical protein TNCV_296281 [Trichonephila clavipes]|nr:hypothetical protein TNCV_296281 [Trichonephila clavipes]